MDGWFWERTLTHRRERMVRMRPQQLPLRQVTLLVKQPQSRSLHPMLVCVQMGVHAWVGHLQGTAKGLLSYWSKGTGN